MTPEERREVLEEAAKVANDCMTVREAAAAIRALAASQPAPAAVEEDNVPFARSVLVDHADELKAAITDLHPARRHSQARMKEGK